MTDNYLAPYIPLAAFHLPVRDEFAHKEVLCFKLPHIAIGHGQICRVCHISITKKMPIERMTCTEGKFNKQNPTISIKAVAAFHDRLMILDEKELYHFGASLKDLSRQFGNLEIGDFVRS